jgi:hypothetical protein
MLFDANREHSPSIPVPDQVILIFYLVFLLSISASRLLQIANVDLETTYSTRPVA